MIAQLNTIGQLWGQWMGSMFWQVSLLIILVSVIDKAIRRWAWPQVRYVLWGLVFIKLVIPPTWQMPTSIVSWIQPLVEKRISIQIDPQEEITGISLEMDTDADGSASNQTNISALSGRISLWSILFLGWIVGMVAFGFVLGGKIFQLHRWHRQHKTQKDSGRTVPDWFRVLLTETATRLNLRKNPEIVFSSYVVSPAVYGLIRPVLLLPEDFFIRLSREETEHVLIHELCHLKRGDLWVHWFCLILQMVYWFNPLLIWTRRRMRYICEICCDLSVAAVLREKTRFYRDTLIRTAKELFTETVEPGLGLLGVFEEPFRIVPRLQWLEKKTWENRKRKSAAILFTSLLMIICVMPMAGRSGSLAQEEGFDSNSLDSGEQVSQLLQDNHKQVSEPAQEALSEAQRRREQNPAAMASARQPLIDFMSVYPSDIIPLVMYQMLGQLWYADKEAENNLEEAQKVFEAGFEGFPDDKLLLLNYAVTTYELKQYEEAALLFEDYSDLVETKLQYLEYAAASYYMAGNKVDAKRIFLKMLRMTEKPNPKWLQTLIVICKETGALDEAEQYKTHLRNIMDISDDDFQLDPEAKDHAGIKYDLFEVDRPPIAIRTFAPEYSLTAKAEQIEGKVLLRFVVDTDGKAQEPEVVMAVPYGVFEESALEAVKDYQFKPALKNGIPVPCIVQMPIEFDSGREKNIEPPSQAERVSSFNFNNSGIKVFINFVGDMTGKNFLIDDDVKGKVTVFSPSAISIDELDSIFQSVLDKNGFEAVPSGDIIWIKKKDS